MYVTQLKVKIWNFLSVNKINIITEISDGTMFRMVVQLLNYGVKYVNNYKLNFFHLKEN